MVMFCYTFSGWELNLILKPLINKFIKDKHGKVALWQMPNLPLTAWFIFMVAARLADAGRLKSDLEFLSTVFLFTWAYLEIWSGASYFRRLLGLAVLMDIIVAHI